MKQLINGLLSEDAGLRSRGGQVSTGVSSSKGLEAPLLARQAGRLCFLFKEGCLLEWEGSKGHRLEEMLNN